jgi:hypothetical protein
VARERRQRRLGAGDVAQEQQLEAARRVVPALALDRPLDVLAGRGDLGGRAEVRDLPPLALEPRDDRVDPRVAQVKDRYRIDGGLLCSVYRRAAVRSP